MEHNFHNMLHYAFGAVGTKWYHFIWPTHRRRQLFKIPATARICERVIQTSCTAPGWTVGPVAVTCDTVHLLVGAPARLARDVVLRELQERASRALRESGVVATWPRRLWASDVWSAVLTHARARNVVRERLSRLSCGGAAAATTSTQ